MAQQSTLITALNKIVADYKEIQSSGNLQARLREMEPEAREELADATHESSGVKPEVVFQLALDMGREIRQKPVYGIEVDRQWYYFVGTENDIIQKMEKVAPEVTDDKTQEAIDDLDKVI